MASLPTSAPPAAQTLSTLRSMVRSGLNEESTLFWSNTEIHWAINFAKDELWKVIRDARQDYFLYRSGTTPYYPLSITADTHTYTLPTDLVEIRQIIPDPTATNGTENYTYTPSDIAHPDFIAARMESDGTSSDPADFFYDIIASQYDGTMLLHVAPTPQTAHTVFLSYIRSLPDMTAEDHTCDIPPEHHKLLVPMAVSYLMMKDRDQGYQIWLADWKDRLNYVKASVTRRQTAGQEYVIPFEVEL